MMSFFNDIFFELLAFFRALPLFVVKAVVLYFLIKSAVKKALQETEALGSKKNQKDPEDAP